MTYLALIAKLLTMVCAVGVVMVLGLAAFFEPMVHVGGTYDAVRPSDEWRSVESTTYASQFADGDAKIAEPRVARMVAVLVLGAVALGGMWALLFGRQRRKVVQR